MGFWDKVKQFFGVGGATGVLAGLPSTRLEEQIRDVVTAPIGRRAAIDPIEIAAQLAPGGYTAQDLGAVADAIERLYELAIFQDAHYSKTWFGPPHNVFVYHPVETNAQPPAHLGPVAPAASSPTKPPKQAPSTAAVPQASAPGSPYRTGHNPYEAKGILGLSPDEMRKRALRIDPYKTAWIGRVDTIPPQSDERTALIDRGLILRGLLTPQQITEIHQVGDLWIKHSGLWKTHAKKIAQAAQTAAKSADAAILEQRRQKAAAKAEKKRLAAERDQQRAREVLRRRAQDIVFLGRGVSAGLADRRSNIEALEKHGLPVLSTPADVARVLGVGISRLRWLCFHSEALQRTHYVYFEIPKRSGGTRLLSAPQKTLATAQRWVLDNVLAKLPTEEPAHGFVAGRSTVTCALPHVDRDVVVNLDLSAYFPSIGFRRIRGVFRRLGYSPAVATVFALLCTESPRRRVDYDGTPYWVAVGERALPQGACTSPALSNQVSRKLDRRLRGMSAKMGWNYTRYADDLTFSAPPGKREQVALLLARVRHIVDEEGFTVNPNKGRVQRSGGRQTVTGIVVNDRLTLPREEVRRLRAILHAAKKTGLDAQNRDSHPHFASWLRGKLAYLAMIDRDRGTAMLRELDALVGRSTAG